jgi:hypothetical protein
MSKQTTAEVFAKIILFVGTEFTLPITKHKGRAGHFLQDLVGIPRSGDNLDMCDGELKLFPVVKLKKNGTLVAKETIAITMLCEDELRTSDFKSSKCCQKMNKLLFVPYLRNGDKIQFMYPKIIDRDCSEFAKLYNTIESDYNQIKTHFIDNGILESKTGTLLQNRTKGRGGPGKKTRAYYLRKAFVKDYIPLLFSL